MNAVKVGMDVARGRQRAGFTQAELARKAGTTQPVISLLENGVKVPGYGTLERIAIACGQPITIVLGGQPKTVSREEKRLRVRRVLGDFEFNPWDRNPTPAESRSLVSDGLSRERFSS